MSKVSKERSYFQEMSIIDFVKDHPELYTWKMITMLTSPDRTPCGIILVKIYAFSTSTALATLRPDESRGTGLWHRKHGKHVYQRAGFESA